MSQRARLQRLEALGGSVSARRCAEHGGLNIDAVLNALEADDEAVLTSLETAPDVCDVCGAPTFVALLGGVLLDDDSLDDE